MTKTAARKIARIRRDCYTNARAVSNRIVKDIVNAKILDNCRNVGIYYPIKNEINVLSLVSKYPNIKFYLPKTAEEISFYLDNDCFKEGLFGTVEPDNDLIIDRDSIDAFIIPSVGINRQRQRLGYGKGYYDRYLTGYKGIKIGVQYKELCDLDFEGNEFDVVFDYIFKR